MRGLVIATTAVAAFVVTNCSAASAHERFAPLLTRAQTRAYHACLFEAWIEDYCRANATRWSPNFDRTYPTCVLANGGGKFPLRDGWGFNSSTDDYCWNAVKSRFR